jgi:hypothetical protein
MIRRFKKTRKYQAPRAKVTPMLLESNFCQTVRFNVDVQPLDNRNAAPESERAAEYFEDIIS